MPLSDPSAPSAVASPPPVVFDRAGAERDTSDLLEAARSTSSTRVMAVCGDAVPAHDVGLVLLPAEAFAGRTSVSGAVADVTDGSGAVSFPTSSGVREWAFLGRDRLGAAILLAVIDDESVVDLPADAAWASLRAVGGDLTDADAQMVRVGVALAGWLRDAAFCPFCGARTEVRQGGWSRHCPSCGREHFPRTDPAVIVLVTDAADGDRILLGANAAWGGERYSCFAGFTEAGESLEETVAREIFEEAGVRVREVVYRGSQPWPYPRSLMLGFRAVVEDAAIARPDGEEIVEVRWFTRQEIGAALRGGSGPQLPGAASIARRLIEDWYGERA